MRIISGTAKGTKLYTLEGLETRPTLDRVKESVFNIIHNEIIDSTVLDLFSGSGNLGIEALSEGASFAYLVDYNKKASDTIKRNLNTIGIKDAEVINLDYKKALNYLKDKKIDLIFLDPPYKTDFIEQSIKLIDQYNILSDEGLIICENDSLDKIVYPDNYEVVKDRKYGDKWVVILRKIC